MDTTKRSLTDKELIEKIEERFSTEIRPTLLLDDKSGIRGKIVHALTIAHKVHKLDLETLLDSMDDDFSHDVVGIFQSVSPNGYLRNFVPFCGFISE